MDGGAATAIVRVRNIVGATVINPIAIILHPYAEQRTQDCNIVTTQLRLAVILIISALDIVSCSQSDYFPMI
jgi:hypothetical protein